MRAARKNHCTCRHQTLPSSPGSRRGASPVRAPRSGCGSAAAGRRSCCCTAIRRRTRCGTGSRRGSPSASPSSAPTSRGYGDSAKPEGGERHVNYSKRAMAADQVAVMRALGFSRFMLAGHDRGARVAHRLCLDHPDAVERVAVLDISPTRIMYGRTDKAFASAYYHWFFLIQPFDLPERLIGADPDLLPAAQDRRLVGRHQPLRSARAGRVRALLREPRDHSRDLRGLSRGGRHRSRARRGRRARARRVPAAGTLGRQGSRAPVVRPHRGLGKRRRRRARPRAALRTFPRRGSAGADAGGVPEVLRVRRRAVGAAAGFGIMLDLAK